MVRTQNLDDSVILLKTVDGLEKKINKLIIQKMVEF